MRRKVVSTGGVPRAALYARCSGRRQAEKELSIPGQLDALRLYARQHGMEIVAEFIDEAESACTADRPQFQEMVSRARKRPREFEVILVWKLSRFSRNREDSVLYKSLLRRAGVTLISLQEPLDDSPAGRMLEGMLELVDEFYIENLSQDTFRGMEKNANLGYLNGGTIPTGYVPKRTGTELSPKWVLEPDPVYGPLVQRVFRMALAGEGACAIAAKLHEEGQKTRGGTEWTKTAVLGILRNEAYTGVLVWGIKHTGRRKGKESVPIRKEGTHEALVTREEFDQVQALLEERKPARVHPRQLGSAYLLAGLLRCGYCGSPFIGHPAKSGQAHYYACQKKMKTGAAACEAKLLPQARAEVAVVAELRRSVLTASYLSELVRLVNAELGSASSQHAEELAGVEAELAGVKKKLSRLYAALEDGDLEMRDLAPRIRERKEEQDKLEARKSALKGAGEGAVKIELSEEEICRYIEGLHAMLEGASLSTRKAFLRSWVDRIEARGTELTIIYGAPPLPAREGLVLQPQFVTPDGREVRFEGDPSLGLEGDQTGIREIMLSDEDRQAIFGAGAEEWEKRLEGKKQKKQERRLPFVLAMGRYGSPPARRYKPAKPCIFNYFQIHPLRLLEGLRPTLPQTQIGT